MISMIKDIAQRWTSTQSSIHNPQSLYKAFTLIELTMILVIIGVLAAIAVPTYLNLRPQADQATIQSVAAALTSASAVNYRLCRSEAPNAVAIADCQDVANVLPTNQPLPDGYTIDAQAIAPNELSACTIWNPEHTVSAKFVGRGCAIASGSGSGGDGNGDGGYGNGDGGYGNGDGGYGNGDGGYGDGGYGDGDGGYGNGDGGYGDGDGGYGNGDGGYGNDDGGYGLDGSGGY